MGRVFGADPSIYFVPFHVQKYHYRMWNSKLLILLVYYPSRRIDEYKYIYAVTFVVKGNASIMQLVKDPFCAHPESCIQVAQWEKKKIPFTTAPYGFVLFVVIQRLFFEV